MAKTSSSKVINDVLYSMVPHSVYNKPSSKLDNDNIYMPNPIINKNATSENLKAHVNGYSAYWKAVNTNIDLVKDLEASASSSYHHFIKSPLVKTRVKRFALHLNKPATTLLEPPSPYNIYCKFKFSQAPEVVLIKYQYALNMTEYRIRKDFINASTVPLLLNSWTGATDFNSRNKMIDRKKQLGTKNDMLVFYIKIPVIPKEAYDDIESYQTVIDSYITSYYVQLTVHSDGKYTVSYVNNKNSLTGLDPYVLNYPPHLKKYSMTEIVGRLVTLLIKNYHTTDIVNASKAFSHKNIINGRELFKQGFLENFPYPSTSTYKWDQNQIISDIIIPSDIKHLSRRIRAYLNPVFRVLYQDDDKIIFTASIFPMHIQTRKTLTKYLYLSEYNVNKSVYLNQSADKIAKLSSIDKFYTPTFIAFYKDLYGELPEVLNDHSHSAVIQRKVNSIQSLVIVTSTKANMMTKVIVQNESSINRIDFINMALLQMITAKLPLLPSRQTIVEPLEDDFLLEKSLVSYNHIDKKTIVDDDDQFDTSSSDEDKEDVGISEFPSFGPIKPVDLYDDDNDSDYDDIKFDSDSDDVGMNFDFDEFNKYTKVEAVVPLLDSKDLVEPKIPVVSSVLDFKKTTTKGSPCDLEYRQLHNLEPQKRVDGLLYTIADKKKNFSYTPQYNTLCKSTYGVIPIILTNEEYEAQKDNLKNSDGTPLKEVSVGSSKVVYTNYKYACPEIWCPITRQAYSETYFKTVLGNKCPNFNGISQAAIKLRDSNELPTGKTNEPYKIPGNPSHPLSEFKIDDGTTFIYPCCGQAKKIKDLNKNTHLNTKNDIEIPEFGKSVLLPSQFIKEQFVVSATDICHRYAGNYLSFAEHAMAIIGKPVNKIGPNPNHVLADLVEQNMTPFEYITLNGGRSVKRWLSVDCEEYIGSEWWNRNVRKVQSVKDPSFGTYVEKIDKYTRLMILKSFKGFLHYLRDDTYVKTHQELFHLFSEKRTWLNNNGIRLIVFLFKFSFTDAKPIYNEFYGCPYTKLPDEGKLPPIGMIIATKDVVYTRVVMKKGNVSTDTTSHENYPVYRRTADVNREAVDNLTEQYIAISHGKWKSLQDMYQDQINKVVVLSWDFIQVAWSDNKGKLFSIEQVFGNKYLDYYGRIITKDVNTIVFTGGVKYDLDSIFSDNFRERAEFDKILIQSYSIDKAQDRLEHNNQSLYKQYKDKYSTAPRIRKQLLLIPEHSHIILHDLDLREYDINSTDPKSKLLAVMNSMVSAKCNFSYNRRVEYLVESMSLIVDMEENDQDKPSFTNIHSILRSTDPSLYKTLALELMGERSIINKKRVNFDTSVFANDNTEDTRLDIFLSQQDIYDNALMDILNSLKHYKLDNQINLAFE